MDEIYFCEMIKKVRNYLDFALALNRSLKLVNDLTNLRSISDYGSRQPESTGFKGSLFQRSLNAHN